MYEKLALELTALAFLFQCIRFIWKIEIERYKMRKKKNRRLLAIDDGINNNT